MSSLKKTFDNFKLFYINIEERNSFMDEIKITDTIIIDEPGFVETAIRNLTGKTVDFTVIKKFILSEKNTKFYINHKLNSSIEPNIYSDFCGLIPESEI